MLAFRKYLLAGLLAFALPKSPLEAHMDPSGETQPKVVVEDGNFGVYFLDREHGSQGQRYVSRYTPEGKLLPPAKQLVQPAQYKKLFPQTEPSEEIVLNPTDAPAPGSSPLGSQPKVASGFYFNTKQGSGWKHNLLPLPFEDAGMLREFVIEKTGIGLAWSSYSNGREPMLNAAWITRPNLQALHKLNLGPCAEIYDFPVVSNLVIADDKLWLGWVRKADKFDELHDMKRWETVMGSVDLKTGKVQQRILPEQSHWNSRLRLNVSKGWLCLAWHCSQDGSYPGNAKIMTHFHEIHPK